MSQTAMQHTEGPWEWVYDGGGTYSIGQAPDAQANPPHVTIWDRNHARAEANARLIASSPQMLEALKVAKIVLEHYYPRSAKAIDDVIDKATGGVR